MTLATLSLTAAQARALFVRAQGLAGPAPAFAPTSAGLLAAARALGCVQLDPISVVARSHQLVLFSRAGAYDLAALDQVLWEERSLFEYWAHCASLVLTEDYPVHAMRMRGYRSPRGPKSTAWGRRMRAWVQDNARLKRYVLTQIKKHGPLPSRALDEAGVAPRAWVSTGWTSGRNISRMLDFLWLSGQIMVAGREGVQRLWDLSERCLPAWAPRQRLTERAATGRAIATALQALGVATPRHIQNHFVRGRYPFFAEALADLVRAGRVRRATVAEWPGEWYALADAEPPSALAPRTVLLSPFDNLIADRARTAQFFGFDFRIEIYTPAAKRRYGYYVLPILQGDRLIGRVDPALDRAAGVLTLHAVHAEPDAPRAAGPQVAAAITTLAAFLGAREIRYNRRRVPPVWRTALKDQ